jgi:hypothetical protein
MPVKPFPSPNQAIGQCTRYFALAAKVKPAHFQPNGGTAGENLAPTVVVRLR